MFLLSASEKKFFSSLTIISIVLHILFAVFIINYNNVLDRGIGTDFSVIAENIVTKGIFSKDGIHDSFFRPPLYPYVLALAKVISTENYGIIITIFQAMLSMICSLLVALIALRVSQNRKVAMASFTLYLLHSKLQIEHLAERETVFFELFLLIFILFFIKNRLHTKNIILLSGMAGFAHLARPNGFTLLLILIAGILVSKYMFSYQLPAKNIFFAVLVFCLINLPWQIYNYTSFGHITLSSSNTNGLNLFKGNDPVIQTIYPQVDIDLSAEYLKKEVLPGMDLVHYTYAQDSALRSRAVAKMIENPIRTLGYMTGKFISFYSPLYVPFGKGKVELVGNELRVTDFRMRLEFDILLNFLQMLCVIPIGIIGLIKINFRKNRKTRFQFFAILLFVLNTSIYIITFAETRFRLPFDSLLIISFCIVIADYYKQIEWKPRQQRVKHD